MSDTENDSLSLSQLRDRVLGDWDSSASDLDMQPPWTQPEPSNQAASPVNGEDGVDEDETEEERDEEEVLGPDDLMEVERDRSKFLSPAASPLTDPPLDLNLDNSDDLDSQLASQRHVRFDPSPSKSPPPSRRQSTRSTKGKEPSRFSPQASANPQPRQAPSKSIKVAEHRRTTLVRVNNDPPVVSKSAREERVEQRAKKRKPPPAKQRTSSKSRKISSTKGFKDIDKIQKGGARGAKKKAASEVSASQTSVAASSSTSRDPPLSFKHSVRRQAPPKDPPPPSAVDIMVHWSVIFGTEVVWSDSNVVSTEGDLAQFDVDSLTAANDHAIGAGLTSASRRKRTARLSTNLTKNSDAGIWSAFDTTRHWLVVIQAAQLAFKNKRKEIKLTVTDYWSNSPTSSERQILNSEVNSSQHVSASSTIRTPSTSSTPHNAPIASITSGGVPNQPISVPGRSEPYPITTGVAFLELGAFWRHVRDVYRCTSRTCKFVAGGHGCIPIGDEHYPIGMDVVRHWQSEMKGGRGSIMDPPRSVIDLVIRNASSEAERQYRHNRSRTSSSPRTPSEGSISGQMQQYFNFAASGYPPPPPFYQPQQLDQQIQRHEVPDAASSPLPALAEDDEHLERFFTVLINRRPTAADDLRIILSRLQRDYWTLRMLKHQPDKEIEALVPQLGLRRLIAQEIGRFIDALPVTINPNAYTDNPIS
ncbi:Hypothetical protein D9617_149g089130 [Elsinoe fawcettii]|nr:Hypothetical protein D9617_149g089130 [Elsinoe fawcettii]